MAAAYELQNLQDVASVISKAGLPRYSRQTKGGPLLTADKRKECASDLVKSIVTKHKTRMQSHTNTTAAKMITSLLIARW